MVIPQKKGGNICNVFEMTNGPCGPVVRPYNFHLATWQGGWTSRRWYDRTGSIQIITRMKGVRYEKRKDTIDT